MNATTALPCEMCANEALLIRILTTDRATEGLLREWLEAAGYRLAGDSASAELDGEAALTIVDIPFARHGAVELLRRVSAQQPRTPILALSATFFSNVKCSGECASTLGVAGVLPKPVTREALLAAVEGLLRPAQ